MHSFTFYPFKFIVALFCIYYFYYKTRKFAILLTDSSQQQLFSLQQTGGLQWV